MSVGVPDESLTAAREAMKRADRIKVKRSPRRLDPMHLMGRELELRLAFIQENAARVEDEKIDL